MARALPTSSATVPPMDPGSPTVPASPTPPPTSQATETPIPVVVISVPQAWKQEVEGIAAAHNQESSSVELQVTTREGGQLRLVHEPGKYVVKREPVAFAVPFSSEREEISGENAQAIAVEGHEQIEVMPWSEMPLGMRALRVDGRFVTDDDYPFQDVWSLQAQAGYEAAAEELLPALQGASSEPVIHLVAVGDIMLDRSLGYALENGDLAYPFAKVNERLQSADITIGNVESAMGDVGEPAHKRYPFRAPPEAAQSLAEAGFDIVSLANNHAGDYGLEALLQAIELLKKQGIATIGAGANAQEAHTAHIEEVKGLKVAFLGYVNVPVEASTGFDTATWTAAGDSPGVAWGDPAAIRADVKAVRDEVDLVVVVLHSGFEYQSPPSEPQMTAAKAAVDAGADLVIGHHAHILQGIEFYRESTILYGTGNFAFEIDGPPETAVFELWLDRDGVRQVDIYPAIIQFGGQPRMAESWEAPAIRDRVYYLTDVLNVD